MTCKNNCYLFQVLDEAAAAVAAGVTTDEIDRVVHEATVDRCSFKLMFSAKIFGS